MENVKIEIPKIDIAFAKEYCYGEHGGGLGSWFGVYPLREVRDFINSERLGDMFAILARNAKPYLGKHFIARVRPDDQFINYEYIDLESGEMLGVFKTLRGIIPLGEWECFVFSVGEVNVKYDSGKIDLEKFSYSAPVEFITRKEEMLFFAPPRKSLFVRN